MAPRRDEVLADAAGLSAADFVRAVEELRERRDEEAASRAKLASALAQIRGGS